MLIQTRSSHPSALKKLTAFVSASMLTGILCQSSIASPVLPEEEYDYVAYAEDNLPAHFIQGNNPTAPINQDNTPDNNPITNSGATLGRVLFYDVNLSVNNAVSCASCHQQSQGFSDSAVLSTGFQGGLTGRHSMSLANSRYYQNGHFFWDERADTLEAQVLMPIQDDVEMGMTLADLVVKLSALDYYDSLFASAFGDSEVTAERISSALAQFTRAMVSYQSRYDAALQNNQPPRPGSNALTPDEQAGRAIFEGPAGGCARCHIGVAQVATVPHNIGLDLTTIDEGAGQGRFKVPSLRNIAVTAPYMHDGRFATLAEVINHYDTGIQNHPDLDPLLRGPNGQPVRLNLTPQQRHQLELFLNTLTDETFLNSELFSDPFTGGVDI